MLQIRFILLVLSIILISSCSDDEPVKTSAEPLHIPPNISLKGIDVSSSGNVMYPDFQPNILHYAVTCFEGNSLDLQVEAFESNTISINGNSVVGTSHSQLLENLSLQNDVQISISNEGYRRDYYLHCIDETFPVISINKYIDSEIDDGFFILSPRVSTDDGIKSYLMIIDNNGVPRFRKKIAAIVTDFKLHENKYSYAERTQRNEFGHWDYDIVLMDQQFNELNRLNTINLNHTDNHDFLVTQEGTYILLSYNSAYRDFSPYGLSSNELTRDSVVQEIDENNNLLMEWNSWDHLDIEDCKQHRWPDDYAHINSVSVSSDDNLILSLRGCSTILKIDRITGETIWQIGGSNPSLDIIGDQYFEFCGQHTATELNGSLFIFDNGGYCLGDRENQFGQFSRALEYKIDSINKTAEFLRDYSYDNLYSLYTPSGGSLTFSPKKNNWIYQ